jgi:hypothetical protein
LRVDQDRHGEAEPLDTGCDLAELFGRMGSRIAFAGGQPRYRNKFDPAVPLLQLTTRLAHRVGRSVVLPIDALKKAR